MDVDRILSAFNDEHADYILIGGMNFFLNHAPVVTFDIDLWISDVPSNIDATHRALASLNAEASFDRKGDDWRRVSELGGSGWIRRQGVHCLNSPHGPIDIFLSVPGLGSEFTVLKPACPIRKTPGGVAYRSLNDDGMIRCQLALPAGIRKLDRLRALGYEGKSNEGC